MSGLDDRINDLLREVVSLQVLATRAYLEPDCTEDEVFNVTAEQLEAQGAKMLDILESMDPLPVGEP